MWCDSILSPKTASRRSARIGNGCGSRAAGIKSILHCCAGIKSSLACLRDSEVGAKQPLSQEMSGGNLRRISRWNSLRKRPDMVLSIKRFFRTGFCIVTSKGHLVQRRLMSCRRGSLLSTDFQWTKRSNSSRSGSSRVWLEANRGRICLCCWHPIAKGSPNLYCWTWVKSDACFWVQRHFMTVRNEA